MCLRFVPLVTLADAICFLTFVTQSWCVMWWAGELIFRAAINGHLLSTASDHYVVGSGLGRPVREGIGRPLGNVAKTAIATTSDGR